MFGYGQADLPARTGGTWAGAYVPGRLLCAGPLFSISREAHFSSAPSACLIQEDKDYLPLPSKGHNQQCRASRTLRELRNEKGEEVAGVM